MDMPDIEFGIVGHDDRFLVPISTLESVISHVHSVADAAAAMVSIHTHECGCEEGVSLTEHVWVTSLPLDAESNVALEDYFPSERERVPADAVLVDLFAGETRRPGTVVMFGRNSDASVRCARFAGVRRLDGDLCRVSYMPSKSPPNTADFSEILSTPGTCYVDVTERIEPWYFCNRQKKMPIIRRPAGYGKSTFLSMCATTFTRRGGDPTLPFRRIRDEWAVDWRGPRPVLSLDFSALDFCGDPPGHAELPDRHEMVTHADAFMREAASAFAARHLPGQESTPCDPHLPYQSNIAAIVHHLDMQLFLTIDNYTSPFLRVGNSAFQKIEEVIWERVLGPLLDPEAGIVFRGLVVGPALHGLRPFSSYPWFSEATEDLSDSAEYASAIGFTSSDALGLSRAVLGDVPHNIESISAVLRLKPTDRSILCARDVVRMLRILQAGDVPAPDDSPDRIYPGSYDDRVDMDLDGDDDIPDVPDLQPSQSHDSAFSEPMTPFQPEHDSEVAAAASKSLQSHVPEIDGLKIDD